MAKRRYLLAIDQGTTGTHVLVVDDRLEVVGEAYREFTQHFPRPGWVEHELREIWKTVERCCKKGLADADIRPDMVTAIGKAFIFRWAGRVSVDSRPVVKLNFEPDPTYRSSARFASLYAHSRGIAWVDESSGQLMGAQAELTEDVSWGAGIIAKLYRGGQFNYEQHEVAPGVWMPTHYSYDFDGRKFLFSLNMHERMDYNDYLRLGPPEEALVVIRREHPGIFTNQN